MFDFNWLILVVFVVIVGAGGMFNTFLFNYVWDKGWGMGKLVGAIFSVVGGYTIMFLYVGKVFFFDEFNMVCWCGWIRHIFCD